MDNPINKQHREQELDNIFSDFKLKKQTEAQEEIKEKNKSFYSGEKLRKSYIIIGFMISVFLFISFCVKLFSQDSPLHAPQPYAMGTRSEFDLKIDGCVLNLWRLRKALDLYYADNKKFPQKMTELKEKGYLNKELVCPVSKMPYIFKKHNNVSVYACPAAHEHNPEIVDIYCNVVNSPPVIVRLNDEQK